MSILSPNFQKTGPGVRRNEPEKKGVSLFLHLLTNHFWNLIKLNIIFIIFSLPIITLGASLGAMASVTKDMINNRPIDVFYDFRQGFKANWRQSTTITILLYVVFFILTFCQRFYYNVAQSTPTLYIIFFICFAVTIYCFFISLYIFPLLTSVNLTLKNIFRNATLLSIACLKETIICSLTWLSIIVINLLLLPLSIPLLFIITFSLLSFITSFSASYGIKKYIIKN